MKLIFKYGVHYREVMHTPRVDWCNTMENYDRNDIINSPLKQLLKLVEDSAPSAVHKCPYTVTLNNSKKSLILRSFTGTRIEKHKRQDGIGLVLIPDGRLQNGFQCHKKQRQPHRSHHNYRQFDITEQGYVWMISTFRVWQFDFNDWNRLN